MLKGIFDDGRFAGSNWHDLQGRTVSSGATGGAVQGTGFELAAEHGVGATVHGVEFVGLKVVDSAIRSIELMAKNHFRRCLTAFVQFANEAGPLDVSDPDSEIDTQRSKFVGPLFTNDTLMGIPLVGDLVRPQRLSFDVPRDASKATIYFGSLGVGGQAFCPEALGGSILTLTINIGLPTIFLALAHAGHPRGVRRRAASREAEFAMPQRQRRSTRHS